MTTETKICQATSWVEFRNLKGKEATFWIEKDAIQIDVTELKTCNTESIIIPFEEFKNIINELRKQGVDV